MPSKSFEMPKPVTAKTAKTSLLSVLSVSGLGYLRKKMTDLNEISPITERFRLNQAKAGQFLIDTLLERVATRVPKGWDATIECAVCGLMPIFPGGSKAVFGCPWCIAGVSAP